MLRKENGPEKKNDFEEASKGRPLSLVQEFVYFIKENKAWWLIPILVAILGISLLVTLGSTGAAPFIYTLF